MSAANAQVLEQYALRQQVGGFKRFRRSVLNFIRHKPLGAFGAGVEL